MSKIVISKGTEGIVVTKKLSRPEVIVDRELQVINRNEVPQLIPIDCDGKKKNSILEINSYSKCTLVEYFNGPIDRQKVLSFIYNMIQVIKSCERNKLNPFNIWLKYDGIFVDWQNGSVRCIYWPIENNKDKSNVPLFFKNLPADFNLQQRVNPAFVQEYLGFFEQTPSFTMSSFEAYIVQMRNADYSQQGQQNAQGYQQHQGQQNAQGYQQHQGQQNAQGYQNQYVGSTLYTGDMQNGQSVVSQDSYAETSVLTMSEGTSVLTQHPYDNPIHAKSVVLIRRGTNERIIVNSDKFMIGRSKISSNYSLDGNGSISRVHIIVYKDVNGKVVVVDNQSKNGSKLNGRNMKPNEGYEVNNGDEITMANERFVFEIR